MHLNSLVLALTRFGLPNAARSLDVPSRNPSVSSENASLSSQSQPLSKRYTLGPFDKGTQYESSDKTVTINIPAAHFCGDEELCDVAQRQDPTKSYSTSLNYYVDDLRKATISQRHEMVLANLRKVQDTIAVLCPSQSPSEADFDKASAQDAQKNPSSVVTLVKTDNKANTPFGINLVIRGTTFNGTKPPFMFAGIAASVSASQLVKGIIRDLQVHTTLKEMKQRDQWVAASLTMFAQSCISLFQRIQDRHVGPDPCAFYSQQQMEDMAEHMLSGFDGKDEFPVRPKSLVDAVNNAVTKDACPRQVVEGVSGEVVG